MTKRIAGAVTALFTLVAGSLSASAQTASDFNTARALLDRASTLQCQLHNGNSVAAMPMSAAGLYGTFDVRFGNADYVEGMGYRTFLDLDHLVGASPQLQAFIVEHENAHHCLGHTYEAYDKGFITQDRHHAHERAADCEAIRNIALTDGYRGRETVSAIFDELAQVNEQIIADLPIAAAEREALLSALPQRSADRRADGLSCPIY